MAQQIKKKFIQDDAVDGLKILLQQDQDLRRILGDGSTQDVIAYLEGLISSEEGRALAAEAGLETRISDLETQVGDDLQAAISQLQSEIAAETSARQSADTNLQSQITSLQGVDNVYFEDNSSVYADATAPIEDPSGRDGWYYKSAGSPDKVNWYFHDGTATPITVGQWQNLYTVATVDSSSNDTFHLSYYTIAQGDGNDAGSWYRSRIVYVPQNGFARGVKTLFYMGQEPDASLYPDLPRVQMIESTVPGSSIGPNEDSESILTVVFGTNSAATAGSVELLVNKLGIQSSVFSAEYSLEIRGEFTLSGIKQSIFEEASARQAADVQLQSNIDVEKSRIDAILEASEADKDSFAEIVSLINSVDTENDQAFAAYVSSNNAALAQEVTDRQNADNTLQSNIDAEVSARQVAISTEATTRQNADNALSSRLDVIEAKGFAKGSQVVGAELAYIDLDREYETMLSVSVGRLAVHEGEDYTVSVVGGVTRLTWIGSLVNPGGAEAIETGDKVFWSGSY